MADIDRLHGFPAEVKQGGFAAVVLLESGGSSLRPEVLADTFGRQAALPRFHMLDSNSSAPIDVDRR
jgi:transaldolase / glucose-6-phosphate isomerase